MAVGIETHVLDSLAIVAVLPCFHCRWEGEC